MVDVEQITDVVEKLLPKTYFHLLAVLLIGTSFLVSVFYGTFLLYHISLNDK